MKRLLKLVLWTLGVLVALLLVALVIVYFYLGSIVKTGIETVGPRFTKCPITVFAVHVAPLSGKIKIVGFTIGNPEGFQAPSAIKFGTVRIQIEPKSLFSDTIVVHEVFIDAPEITYEQSLTRSNITAIKRNVAETTGAGKGAAVPETSASGKPAKKVIIDSVLVRNGKINLSVSVTGLSENAEPLLLPEIALKDIGKQGNGESLGTAAAVILQAILSGVADAVIQNPEFLKSGVEDAKKKAAEKASGLLLKGAKGLFGK